MKIPGIDHSITIEPASGRVIVRAGGRIIADTSAALILREATLEPVYYVPLTDVDQTALARSDRSTYCPFKGDATYFDVVTDDGVIANAVWEYLEPYEKVDAIAGHVAFYPAKVEITAAG